MAFNLSEAGDVNTLLDFHFQRARTGFGVPSSEQARDAAARLADKACARLQTGVTARVVHEMWPVDTLAQLRHVVDALHAAGIGDLPGFRTAVAALDKLDLAELLTLLDNVREQTAELLLVVEEHVAAHLDPVEEDLLHSEIRGVAGTGVLAEVVTTLDPTRPRRPDPELAEPS
jgi:hypothetical protein